MTRSVIASAARTPIGSFQGSLCPLKSTELGAIVIRDCLQRAAVAPDEIDGVVMGCALPAGLGQAPARQAALGAGIPDSVGALTVNKVCSSGLVSVMIADLMIRAKDGEAFVCGGMESMSNAPYILPNARKGLRLGDSKVIDSMVFDGLWDIHTNQHMGSCAELCAAKHGFTRKMQDAFARRSYEKALEAIRSGAFRGEITGVPVPQKGGDPVVFDVDEEPGRVEFDRIPALKPAFREDGTVTAANASSISDGAAALVVMGEARAKREKLRPLARIVSHASFSHQPEWFTTAPIGAVHRALGKAHLAVGDIDLFEINEAFAVVAMAALSDLELDEERVNVNGGAVALGHPIGASGARILTTLIHAMKSRGARRGLATLCNGGGEATAIIIEAV